MTDMEKFAEEVAQMSFETSMEELEKLVQELEQGGTDLDRSLEIYERAVILRDHCKAILDDGQRRIQKIIEAADGIRTEDFGSERSRFEMPQRHPGRFRPFLRGPVQVGGFEIGIRECEPEGSAEGAGVQFAGVERPESVPESDEQDIDRVVAAGGLPEVVQTLGLLQEDLVQPLPADTDVLRAVHDLGDHVHGIQGEAAGIDEAVEIQILEAEPVPSVLRYVHQEADGIAGRYQRLPDGAVSLLELMDLVGVAVLVDDVVERVRSDGHHLHVPAIGVEQGGAHGLPAQQVEIGVDYPEDLRVLATCAHLLDHVLHVVAGVRYQYLRRLPVQELSVDPRVGDTLHEQIGPVVDGALHRYLVADVVVGQEIAHRSTSAPLRCPTCHG